MRTGKIARLPLKIRNTFNRRLQNGTPITKLLPWLNALPEVKAILKEHFGSRPISFQNVSKWTKAGYRDWLHQQETHDLAHTLSEDTTAFTSDHPPLTDTYNHWLTARLLLLTRRINALDESDPEASRKLLRETIRDLAILQRGHTQSRREQRQRDHLTFRETQAREKSESLREQTDADHERWALHTDNQDRLWQSLCTAYPDEYKYESDDDDTDDESNASPKNEAPTSGHPERSEGGQAGAAQSKHPVPSSCSLSKDPTPHSQSGPAASLQNAVTLSEVEGPHPFAGPSPASPHAEVPEHSSPSISSSSHSSPASESEPIFCHTTGTYIHYDDDEAAPSPSAPSSSPCHSDPVPHPPLSPEATIHAKLDTFDTELRILRQRIEELPPPPPPRPPSPSDKSREFVARLLWPKAVARLGVDGAYAEQARLARGNGNTPHECH